MCVGNGAVPDARWSDLADAAAAADKPSSSQTNPRLTTQQPARRPAHKVQQTPLQCLLSHTLLQLWQHRNETWDSAVTYTPATVATQE